MDSLGGPVTPKHIMIVDSRTKVTESSHCRKGDATAFFYIKLYLNYSTLKLLESANRTVNINLVHFGM